ncbi:MAG TPA: immunoglobulin-like domain-containing protein, partial [Gammaproteobacteria bacterium]|nr:immunoglobulin-like domain-containing protein [Gammaproteobacteria bacterium]
GATASDPEDGDLTSKITVDNPVDTSVIGTYTVTYNVVDSSGNAAAPMQRSVDVKARQAAGGGGGGGISIELGLLALAALSAVRRRGRARRGTPAARLRGFAEHGASRRTLAPRPRGRRP